MVQNRIAYNHRDRSSPMEALRPAILKIASQRGRMNQSHTMAEGLQLSNSLIKNGSEIEADVMIYII